MNDAELLQEVAAALAATDLTPFVTGGQKLVCTAKLAGQDVIVKVIRGTGVVHPYTAEVQAAVEGDMRAP